MQSYTRLASRLSEEEVRRGVEELSPWFYSFDLGDGLRTVSAVPPQVESPAATANPPDLGYDELPGYGKSYAGPGTRNVRATTRI